MNYIAEIKSFYDWLEWNSISTSAICLWHALMHIANKTGWKQEFTVPMETLELKTGLKRTTVCDARNTLKQNGLIEWKPRSGNQCAVYTLCSFNEYSSEHKPDTAVNTTPSQVPTQSRTLNKLNKTKQNNIKESIKENEPHIVKHKYGEYKNVLFTDEEFAKLKEEYPNDWSDRIERLSEYIASTGKSYKSHLATIRSWAKKDSGYKANNKPPDYSDPERYKNLKME